MRTLAKTVALIFTCALVAFGEQGADDSKYCKLTTGNDVSDWMMNYYKNPQPENVSLAIKISESEKILTTNPGAQAPFAGFLSIIFQNNPQQVEAWLTRCDTYAGELKRTVWLGLWLSDTDFSRQYLSQKIEGATETNLEYLKVLTKNKPFNLRQIKPNDPGQLDMLWGAFSASGDTQYVKRIISVLPLLDQRDNPIKFTMAASAKWSLKSNGLIHPLVLQTCKEELSNASESTAVHLSEIVSELEGKCPKTDSREESLRILKTEFSKEVMDKYKK